jgi:hypothetical protein
MAFIKFIDIIITFFMTIDNELTSNCDSGIRLKEGDKAENKAENKAEEGLKDCFPSLLYRVMCALNSSKVIIGFMETVFR